MFINAMLGHLCHSGLILVCRISFPWCRVIKKENKHGCSKFTNIIVNVTHLSLRSHEYRQKTTTGLPSALTIWMGFIFEIYVLHNITDDTVIRTPHIFCAFCMMNITIMDFTRNAFCHLYHTYMFLFFWSFLPVN